MGKQLHQQNRSKDKEVKTPAKKQFLLGEKYDFPLIFLLGLLTLLVFSRTAICEFTNWDDANYVVDNELVKNLNFATIKNFFSQGAMGNYHPFTMLVYALEYKCFGLSAKVFHLTNVLFHVITTLLVYRLSRQLKFGVEASVVVTTLFALHPMHVESVAWISETKDVLYALFYIASLIFYVKHACAEKKYGYNYFLSILFFVFALFSKGQAVSLSLVILAIDYYLQRGWSRKIWLEKIPFFALSLMMGIVAIHVQHSFGSMSYLKVFSFLDRILYAAYGLVLYIVKFVVPFKLANYIPFPVDKPFIMYDAPIILLLLIYLIYKYARNNRVLIFGVLFFLASICMVLQLLPVGGTLISERYTYIPYIGFSFIVGSYVEKLLLKYKSNRKLIYVLCGLLICACAMSSYARIAVWKNSMTLWTDAINKYPSAMGYFKRAGVYGNTGKKQAAIADYTAALKIVPDIYDALVYRGNALREIGRIDEAYEDLNKAINMRRNSSWEAYMNRGVVYCVKGMLDKAKTDFDSALSKNKTSPELFTNMGNYLDMAGSAAPALVCYDKAIQLNKNFAEAYRNRGYVFYTLNDYDKAIADYTMVLKLDTNDASALYSRSVAYAGKLDWDKAMTDARKAIDKGYKMDASYIQYLNMKLVTSSN